MESLLVLKNNRGVDENRVRHLDYGVQISKLFYERLIKNEYITLFSPSDVEGMYDSFFANQHEFERLYKQAEEDPLIRKKKVKAVDIFSSLIQERASTGRIYIQNVDHCNTHSAFNPDIAPIRQSNLCVSGDTKLLTYQGDFEISTLVGKTVTIWNGQEWSDVEVFKTGENQDLIKVKVLKFKNGSYKETVELCCTPYHKWYDNTGNMLRTFQLEVGDWLLNWDDPEGQLISCEVVSLTPVEKGDTYCFTEPKRNMGVFNGILTGNCLEIALPTKPLNNINDIDGEIALCTLAAFNLGVLTDLNELDHLSDLIVRGLDSLLDYQNYPVPAAEKASMYRRTLGVGVINYANFLAKNKVLYSDGSANILTHELFEAIQYNLLKASNALAKESGACEGFKETSYAQGLLPIDTYKKAVDDITSGFEYKCDWQGLREDIKKFGLRNSTLTALMPSETSSQVSNATNGIEPPRGLVSVKSSKDGILKQVVPDVASLKYWYELLWDIPDNKGYIELVAIMQKFVDQAISANTNYDPSKFDDGKVPMKVLLKDLLTCYKLGLKTLYYHNTRDGASDNQDDGCEGGACKI